MADDNTSEIARKMGQLMAEGPMAREFALALASWGNQTRVARENTIALLESIAADLPRDAPGGARESWALLVDLIRKTNDFKNASDGATAGGYCGCPGCLARKAQAH